MIENRVRDVRNSVGASRGRVVVIDSGDEGNARVKLGRGQPLPEWAPDGMVYSGVVGYPAVMSNTQTTRERAVMWLCRLLAQCPYIVADPPPSDLGGDPDAWSVGCDPRRPWGRVEAGPAISLEVEMSAPADTESRLIMLSVYRWLARYQTVIRDGHDIAATLVSLLPTAGLATDAPGEVIYDAAARPTRSEALDDATAPPTRSEVIYDAAARPTQSEAASKLAVTPPPPGDLPGQMLFQWMHELVSTLPVLTLTDSSGELLTGEQLDTEDIARAMAAVRAREPDSPIAALWDACNAWLTDMDRVVRRGHELCYRLGVAIGEFKADPAAAPAVDAPPPPARKSRARWAVLGLISAAIAVAAVWVPEQPTQTRTVEIPLPVTESGFSTCKPDVDQMSNIPVALPATPLHRKASTIRFVEDTDTVIVRRKNKPSYRITVVEELPGESKAKPGERTHSVNADDYRSQGLVVPLGGSDMQLTLENPEEDE